MDFLRQAGIITPDRFVQPVTLIGCGGIGSPTAMALTKMGVPDLTLWDRDTVEEHNVPNQMFPLNQIGTSKVEALAALCENFSGTRPTTVEDFYQGQQALKGVVISGVDNMSARQEIFDSLRFKADVKLYIEARMGAMAGRIYTVDPADRKQVRQYETTLYSDAEAAEEPCTARSIIFNVFVLAGLIANQVKRHALGEPLANEILLDLVNGDLVYSQWP